jgi:hypothetical protein
MTLQPGCRFVVAPQFHLSADWSQRLLIGTGVQEVEGSFSPQSSWRPPTADELGVLTSSAEELDDSLCLFQLPAHLRSACWKLLEQSMDVLGDGRLPGLEVFAGQVAEFLAFKGLSMPQDARCELVVRDSQRNLPVGLHCNIAPWASWPVAQEHLWPRLWGGINLGDEKTSIVLINLSCRQLEAELRQRFPEQPAPAVVGELARCFLRSCSDYAPVRLFLEPGEGFRLPPGGLILDGYPEGKREPDVLLSITEEARQNT